MPVVQLDQAANNVHQIILRQNTLRLRNRQIELAVQFIASNIAEVIATGIEEQVLDKRTGVIHGGGIAGSQLFIKFKQRLVLTLDGITVQCRLHITNVGIVIYVTEGIKNALVGRQVKVFNMKLVFRQAGNSTQKCRDRQLTLAINFDRQEVLVAGLEFEPRTATRNKFGGKEPTPGCRIFIGGIVDAGGTY